MGWISPILRMAILHKIMPLISWNLLDFSSNIHSNPKYYSWKPLNKLEASGTKTCAAAKPAYWGSSLLHFHRSNGSTWTYLYSAYNSGVKQIGDAINIILIKVIKCKSINDFRNCIATKKCTFFYAANYFYFGINEIVCKSYQTVHTIIGLLYRYLLKNTLIKY